MIKSPVVTPDSENFPGIYLTDDDVEFGKAVEIFKKKHNKKFLALSQYLLILKSLGYVKCQCHNVGHTVKQSPDT